MKLYHGTSISNALSIMNEGFNLKKAGSNYGTTYGKGIYFTPNYKTAKFYAEENGIDAQVTEPKKRKFNVRTGGYGENFATNRRGAWTH